MLGPLPALRPRSRSEDAQAEVVCQVVRHHDLVATVTVEITGVEHHRLAAADANPVVRPWPVNAGGVGSRMLEPAHAGKTAAPIAQQEIATAVAIHVGDH